MMSLAAFMMVFTMFSQFIYYSAADPMFESRGMRGRFGHYFPARFRVGIRYRFDVFRMDTLEQLAFMECISMLAIARMIMNACIAFSIWHVETEYRMIQASPIHLHYQHMKEVFYRNYRHHISLWRSLNCV